MIRTVKTYTTHQCDIFVIGGGIAGCFAAIRASELGAKVILADKGYVSSSGQTPYAGSLMVFDPRRHNRAEWLLQFRSRGDYLANLDWTNLMLDRSLECFQDLLSYGVKFFQNEDGSCFEACMGDEASRAVLPLEYSLAPALRQKVLNCGVTILDRHMVVELIKQSGRVVGAVGFRVNEAAPFVVESKAVIISAGAAAFKPPSWPVSNLTGDGDVMALRVGAAITGKEFVDPHPTTTENPSYLINNPIKRDFSQAPHGTSKGDPPGPGRMPPVNAFGEPIPGKAGLNLNAVFEVHAGRGPIYQGQPGQRQLVACAAAGMAAHKTEGIWPTGMDCSSGVPGLFAAGDSLGTMMSGASYAGIGMALMGSAVTGKQAAEGAVASLNQVAQPDVCQDNVQKILEQVYVPIHRVAGHKPAWVIRQIQNIMMPYYVTMVKEESRLNAALTQIRYLSQHITPKLRAADAHELRLAIEAKNMAINAELKLVASLARQECRGSHIREDHPYHDEKFSGWIAIRQTEDGLATEFHPMPREWSRQPGEPEMAEFPFEAN